MLTNKNPIVVIGSGLSGYSLVREFRKLDKTTRVLVLTTDDGASYSKPMLSNGFSRGKSANQLVLAEAGQMVVQLNLEIRTFTRVTAIDPANKQVILGDERLAYSKLVIAWGADLIRLPLKGDGLSHLYAVNDLMDYRRFREALTGKRRVVILGAGLIGCEFANDLPTGGYQIDMVAPSDSVLPGLLPPFVGKAVQQGLAEAGVNFHLERFATELRTVSGGLEKVDESQGDNGNDCINVVLDSGEIIVADLVLSAVGLQPRKALAEQVGIHCGRGITVNRKLETNIADIYAFGDCAEVGGHSLLYVLPLMACAKVLAKSLAGQPAEVNYGVMPVIVKTPVCPVAVYPPPPLAQGAWEVDAGDTSLDINARFFSPEGELLGFALTGKAVADKQALTKQVPPLHT